MKELVGQGFQIVITGITYNALTARRQDIHESNGGNSMASHPHLAKSEVTMEGSRGIMGKHTCLLFNQLKKYPRNKADSIKRKLKN